MSLSLRFAVTHLVGAFNETVEGRFMPRNAAMQLVVWPFAKPMLQHLTRRILR